MDFEYEANLRQLFLGTGLKSTGNPLHLEGSFWQLINFQKYYLEVMIQTKGSPKAFVL